MRHASCAIAVSHHKLVCRVAWGCLLVFHLLHYQHRQANRSTWTELAAGRTVTSAHHAHTLRLFLQVEATMYSSSTTVMKQRTFNVCNDVKYAHRLIPIVTAPNQSADGKPRVLWSKFHDTVPVDDSSAAGRAGSISVWPEQGQLLDPLASSSSADGEGSDATATISHRGLDTQRSNLLGQRSGE